MGDVLAVLPFQNTLSTFQLTGTDIVAALENGASQYDEGVGCFAQVAGLKYNVDSEVEPGQRISEVMVRDGHDWRPIDTAKVYGVVSNNYIRAKCRPLHLACIGQVTSWDDQDGMAFTNLSMDLADGSDRKEHIELMAIGIAQDRDRPQGQLCLCG